MHEPDDDAPDPLRSLAVGVTITALVAVIALLLLVLFDGDDGSGAVRPSEPASAHLLASAALSA